MTALFAAPLVPLLGGATLMAAERSRLRLSSAVVYGIALAFAVVALICSVLVAWQRPTINHPWVPAIGMRLHLGVDGISAPLLLLTAAVGVLVVVHAGWKLTSATYLGALLMVTGGALATFLVRDALAFFLAFEIVLIPMWLLIAKFGDTSKPGERDRAASMFVLYTVLGSTLMLIGILVLVRSAGTSDFGQLTGARLPPSIQAGLAALLMIGVGIKIPLWPLHSWLPAAHTAAPTGGSVLLAAVLLKMGTYAVVRLIVFPLPGGFATIAPVVAVLAVIGILVGGLVCLVERSLKRLVAWSSVAHMGFIVLALTTGTSLGLQAALYGNIAHGVIAALLFVVVGGLKERWGDDDLETARRALREVSPRLGLALIVGFAGSLALPGLAGFWGEILALFAAWGPAADRPLTLYRVLAVGAVLGSVLAAAYAIRVLRAVWAGGASVPADDQLAGTVDAHGAEWVVLAVLMAAVVVLGVWPGPIMDQTQAAVRAAAHLLVGGTR